MTRSAVRGWWKWALPAACAALVGLAVLSKDASGLADVSGAPARSAISIPVVAAHAHVGDKGVYLEVITAQNAALANQITAANVLTGRMTASVLLIEALGGGWSTAELVHAHDLRNPARP